MNQRPFTESADTFFVPGSLNSPAPPLAFHLFQPETDCHGIVDLRATFCFGKGMTHAFTIAVTGGVGMGKSSFCRALRADLGNCVEFFDSDHCVHQLLTRPKIIAMLQTEFGERVIDNDGHLDRPRLRELVFDSAKRRAELESILHPEVRKEYDLARHSLGNERSVFLADIPLFFESTESFESDIVVVVACSPAIQLARVSARPGIDHALAQRIIATQLPISEKIRLGDVVVFNDGSEDSLFRQTKQFSSWLKSRLQTTKQSIH